MHDPARVPGKRKQPVQEPILTRRELEILQLMAANKSNKDIGTTLRISAGTVKIHVHSILLKLNVDSRWEAVAKGTKERMLS